MSQLNSIEGSALLLQISDLVTAHVVAVDEGKRLNEAPYLDSITVTLKSARELHANGSDATLNDILILEKYVALLHSYSTLWRLLSDGRCSESWLALQDMTDLLRFIRKFSGLSMQNLAKRLTALETLYPYTIFASCGFIVEHFECSICGNDIDSDECAHRKGELYRGEIARGIARNISSIDHIALVKNPSDKRCVPIISDTEPGFSGVRYLGELLNMKILVPSRFGGVAWSKRMIANPDYIEQNRNETCSCGSGKKFKRCCIDAKKMKEIDHAEIIISPSLFQNGIFS